MNLLLDTQVYLWLRLEAHRLSPKAKAALTDPANQLWFSVMSLWEMTIKFRQGRLAIPGADMNEVLADLRRDDIHILPFLTEHIFELETLDLLHKDPFDRALLAQAIAGRFIFVTADKGLLGYPVEVLWK